MPTKITLTVDDGLTSQEIEDLRYLLVDAIGEFASHRSPAELYVLRRYTHKVDGVETPAFSTDEMARKLEQVKRRIALARRLHNAALNFSTEGVVIQSQVVTK